MESTADRAIAIVGLGAVLPDAPNVSAFWANIKQGRYSITDVSPDRWDPALYYDPNHSAPDKTYSKIGGWVREDAWDPMGWRLPIPPRVSDAMDGSQKWGIACTRQALNDYGYPKRPLNLDRTAVILGNAMGGERHYFTVMRVYFPEYAQELEKSASFAELPSNVRRAIVSELHERMGLKLPEVTEDTMPGELANCIAGRIANVFNFHGPNYVVDAACASAMAAISASVEGLLGHDFDAAITGGIDRNMGASTFVKFSKIGALSATGTRPYAEGADGFVMGEGTAIFLMKRLADAERDGDKIHAVLRGMGGSSDGKGKGITAPNPVGPKLAIERAWENAGLSPATAGLIEGHGTSTRVGDVVEVQAMTDVLSEFNLPKHSIALGSVKSNIGHLKGAAGAAGILKTVLALREKMLPPSVHCEHPNPDIDFTHSPLYVNTELKAWDTKGDAVRRAGASAFGFGGTNFHTVLEEYIPGKLNGNGKRSVAVGALPTTEKFEGAMRGTQVSNSSISGASCKTPLRGTLVIGADSVQGLNERLRAVHGAATQGKQPALCAPVASDLRATERLVIDYADASELADKCAKALKALNADQPPVWKALRAQGIFRGRGATPKVAFLYTGQGSQYVNMLRPLIDIEPIVAETFAEADKVMAPLLGKSLTDYIFVDQADPNAVAKAEDDLRQTEITQPAVLATDEALTRLLAAYGIRPDMTMGHSLGEYGALVASGALPFPDALEAVSARGRGMAAVAMNDNGKMAAVFAPLAEIERTLEKVNGNVVIANINSNSQAVIGGASTAVDQAIALFQKAGYEPVALPVSHAFHTSIVAGASGPLRKELERLRLQSPQIPIVANVDGEFYPTGTNVVPKMLDILSRQVASPVQFVKGLDTLYNAGARVFVEVGPKKALQGFAEDVLGARGDIISIFTNHPKSGDLVAFNQALCALYAAGLGKGIDASAKGASFDDLAKVADTQSQPVPAAVVTSGQTERAVQPDGRFQELGEIFADVLDRAWDLYHGKGGHRVDDAPVVITGASLGLPGTDHIFDDANIGRILRGDQFIQPIPNRFRQLMLDKHITRLVKSDNGGPTFESIDGIADVIKLAARGNTFDLEKEFGVPADRMAALDRVTQLAIGAGIDALRDAGIPLVMRYKTTSKGTQLPDRWSLPDAMRDDTGIIFASAFPGYDSFADEMARYYADQSKRDRLAMLESLRTDLVAGNGNQPVLREIEKRINDLRSSIERVPYIFERRFLFKALSMGHSQFAEFIGARGPNTQINSACATTAQAITLAEDWIRAGRCSRVVIISSDDVTSDHMIEWIGAGFLASGAAATDEDVKEAAIPFDRRRHGMIIGMGAAALVVESAEAAKERGIRPICEVLSSVTANSAFHGTRLDVQHIGQVMEAVVKQAESRRGISRQGIAPKTVFVSHETYTPARGGSASAEIHALRKVFGDKADQIVIANTKGFTGHAMATGIEDVVAVKALETGCVPPVANFKEIDPELGALNLSKGGSYPVEYALHLGAGFGSQISMVLLRWTAAKNGKRTSPEKLGYSYRVIDQATWNSWLTRMAGHPVTNLEIVNRTLRVPDQRNISRAGETVLSSKPAVPVLSTENRKLDETVSVTSAAAETVASTLPVQVSAIPTAASGLSVEERILELVVEKTGYPKDMLDLDLDLEADLGVDTVKQAEVFAAIREIYNIPRDENRRLRDYPTLAHVIRFVHEKRPDLLEKTSHTTLAESVVSEVVVKTQSPPNAPALDGSVQERVLALVVEKTGYPREMLDLDLDLEADLGVDTVKQAEMFAAIREIYNIPRDENRKLRDYPTLTHVIRFVHESRPDLASAPSAPPAENDGKTTASAASPEQADPQGEDESVKERVLALVVEKTGYPKDMLDLDLDLEADLGVDTVKQAEMFAAIREIYNIPRDENRKLRDYPTLAHVIRFVHENRPGKAPAPVEVLMPAVLPAANEIPGVIADSEESIKERVLQIVAEKTGYPKDMLDLDLDLEADLGVDTVKQAEMFAAVRALYSIPRDENLKLRDFPTLAHVIKFARDRRQNPAAVSGGEVKTPMAPSASPLALASFEAANKVPRRVPVPTPRPPLEMCKKTNVTLTAGHRVIVMPDRSGVADALEQQLKLKDVDVLRLTETSAPDVLIDQIKTWIAAGPIQGVYWLPALDDEGTLVDMDVNAWRGAIWLRVKALYTTMRSLYEQIRTPETFLVSATRLGGQHGYDTAGATSPLGGGVTGFTKTYKRERMDALVKTVDFETTRKPTEVADILIAETLRDTGAVEIGYKSGLRWTIGLEEQSASDSKAGLALGRDTVFVVTGAAGSIVSAITADLAAVSGGKFYLLDLVPEPDANNPDLKRFVSDKEGLKRELFQRIQSRGERATPALVEKELSALERANAAQSAIDAVRNAGGTVRYFSVNLTDADSVSRVIDHVRKENRRIDVLLHAAGIERSHFLPDKDQREFDLVFDVKADGWFNLLHAIGNMPLGATVAFSSIAGRFGNAGQTDYSSANDLLCKTTSSFRRTRPETRGIVMDWTAWAGIGMATRGSIPKMMELAGIDMLPPEAGVPMIRRELTLGGTRGEILIGEKLGALLNEWDRSGGLDEDALLEKVARGPMLSKLVKMHRESGLTIETTIDPKVQPFLRDHQIDGTPVLPGVMGIEAFAEASQCILPGWNVQSIEDIDFLAPFKFYRNEPRQVTVETRFQVQEDAIFADCRLIGTRRLPNQKEQFTTHFTGHVRFTKAVPQLRTRVPIGTPKGSIIGASEIYHVYFHGPAYQVLERAWWNRDRVIGLYSETLPANHEPFELPTIVVPRLIELCFQTAGLWELGTTGKMGLPQHVDRIRLFGGKSSQQHPLYAMARPSTRDASLDIEIVDASGSCLMEVRGYRTVSAPGLVDLAHLNALQAAMSEVVMA